MNPKDVTNSGESSIWWYVLNTIKINTNTKQKTIGCGSSCDRSNHGFVENYEWIKKMMTDSPTQSHIIVNNQIPNKTVKTKWR